jgi:hypothetical protein
MKKFILIGFLACSLTAQTRINGTGQIKFPDFSDQIFARPWPVGSNLPPACRSGEAFFLSNIEVGFKLYLCTNPNFWQDVMNAPSGGSGSVSQLADLSDFQVERISGTQLRVGQACSIAKPCRARIGSKLIELTEAATLSLSGNTGSGDLYIWLDEGGLRAGHNTVATIQCSTGCQANSGIAEFPLFSIPLAVVPFSSNTFATLTTAMDRRAYLVTPSLVAGASGNLRLLNQSSSGGVQVDLSPALDFGGSTSTKVTKRGTLAERPSTCSVGELYYQTDNTAGLFHCPTANQWQALSSGPSAIELQADGATVGSRSRLNLTAGAGATLSCSDDGANGRVSCGYSIDSSSLNTTYVRLGSNNTYAAGSLQDFGAASLRIPSGAAAAPTEAAQVAFDTNSSEFRVGRGSDSQTLALQNIGVQALTISRNNDSNTGTQAGHLAWLTPSGTVRTPDLGASGGVIGITLSGAGTSGTAQIATTGVAFCLADNTAVAGNFVTIGATTAGRCADAGASYPASGQVIGRWLSSANTGAFAPVLLFGTGHQIARSRSLLVIGANSATVPASSTSFISPSANVFDATHDNQTLVMPTAGTAVRMSYRTNTAQPASGELACTLRINNVDSTLGFTVTAGQAAHTASVSGSTSWAAGDLLNVRCVNNATAASAAFTSIVFEVLL